MRAGGGSGGYDVKGPPYDPKDFCALTRMRKSVRVPLGDPQAANNRKFQVVCADLEDVDGNTLPGLWIEVKVREPAPPRRRNDKYTLFAMGEGFKPTRVLQVEVYHPDIQSHRGETVVRGPHLHYHDGSGNNRVRMLRMRGPQGKGGRDRWFRLFLLLTNTGTKETPGQLYLHGGFLPWP